MFIKGKHFYNLQILRWIFSHVMCLRKLFSIYRWTLILLNSIWYGQWNSDKLKTHFDQPVTHFSSVAIFAYLFICKIPQMEFRYKFIRFSTPSLQLDRLNRKGSSILRRRYAWQSFCQRKATNTLKCIHHFVFLNRNWRHGRNPTFNFAIQICVLVLIPVLINILLNNRNQFQSRNKYNQYCLYQ